ncbi:Spore development regulator RYP2 [Vanrija pseudolonga]|uniref:Spore development regulator RYP2 n=1 Tax=Vanrija pseudolonga TaxID=143232 RepID=A0AAF0YH74_9TREE|nr:Spore development regulator RYP2 [Vanrija pseudolonga]WOO83499.1 Spore development regulator RYP2 [Vanrija pseudolonga]
MNRTYRITPIQHPDRGAPFAYRPLLSRLPLAPPLIIQLDTWDEDDELIVPTEEELSNMICHLTLETPAGETAAQVKISDTEVVPMLYGTLITTPKQMLDTAGAPGVYFCFPDVSVRFPGRFRLKAYVTRLHGGAALDSCYTEPFEVIPEAQYVEPPITDLTRHFHAQGLVNFGIPANDW